MSSNIRITRVCEYCKEKFTAKTIFTRYCSHACNRRAIKLATKNAKIKKARKAMRAAPKGKLVEVFNYAAIHNKELLTIKETCAFLNITQVTVRRWIKDGVIQSSRIGKKHLIKRSHLNKLI